MNTYTDEDTERVRATQAQPSSAGMGTQALSELTSGYATAIPVRSFRNNLLAFGLIVFGLLALLTTIFGQQLDLKAGFVLFTIASVFLFFAFWKRLFGLLIPGCILAGLSLGVPFADLTDGVSVLWGLALGFMGILGIGRTMFGTRSIWPAIPAVILFAVGVLAAISNLPVFLSGGLLWLPMLLIGAGLILGARRQASSQP